MVHKINDCPGEWNTRDLLQLYEESLLAYAKNCNIIQDHKMLKHTTRYHQEVAHLPVTDPEFANGSNLGFHPETAERSSIEHWYQYLSHLTKNTTIHYVNAINTFEAQPKDVHIQDRKRHEFGDPMTMFNSTILDEEKCDVKINIDCIEANGIFGNKERAAKPFAEADCFAQESTAPEIPLQLDCKPSDSKPLQGQELKQVVEMLRDKNLTELLQLLKRKRVISSGLFDALMNLINEQQVPSTDARCDEVGQQVDDEYMRRSDVFRDLLISLLNPIEFVFVMYTEKELLVNIVSNNELQAPPDVNGFTINIQKFSSDTQQMKTDDPSETEDKQGLTSTASKRKEELLTVVLYLFDKIMVDVQRPVMSTTSEEEASPVAASSDSSSLSHDHSESLSSLEWEDSPNDTLRQLQDMGLELMPLDGSALFMIYVPLKAEMIKSDEGPEKSFPRFATSSLSGSDTNEDNGNDTSSPKKADKKYQTFNYNINLEQIMIMELSSKKVYEQEKI